MKTASLVSLLLLVGTASHADPVHHMYSTRADALANRPCDVSGRTCNEATVVYGRDTYSLNHPGDMSHSPREDVWVGMGHDSPETWDADGRMVHYVWVPGTDHDHRIIVQGAGYSQAARSWIAKHWRVGGPPPTDAVVAVARDNADRHRSSPSSHRASSSAGPERIGWAGPVGGSAAPSRPFNPLAVIAGIVVVMLSAGVLGAVLSARSRERADGR